MIAHDLILTGILQLGVFSHNSSNTPYRLRLELLPAYPELFRTVTHMVVAALQDMPVDRLVALPDSTALAAAVSFQTGLSLVYSRGLGEAPVHDLAGAYNFGHPSCLLVNVISDQLPGFIQNCERVGLKIQTVIALVGDRQSVSNIPVYSLTSMEAAVNDLLRENLITTNQAHTLRDYFQSRANS